MLKRPDGGAMTLKLMRDDKWRHELARRRQFAVSYSGFRYDHGAGSQNVNPIVPI